MVYDFMGDFVIGPFYICSLAQTHFGDAGGGGGVGTATIQLAYEKRGEGVKNYSIKFRCCMGGG